MSYTPNEWDTGDVITAEKMNHLEQGVAGAGSVATVRVNFNDGGFNETVYVYVTHAKYDSTLDGYSIESPIIDYYSTAPYMGRLYVPVSLPPSDDDFKAFVCFGENIDYFAAYTCSGGVSSTKVDLQQKTNSSTWSSEIFHGFEVTGDGTIEVAYED